MIVEHVFQLSRARDRTFKFIDKFQVNKLERRRKKLGEERDCSQYMSFHKKCLRFSVWATFSKIRRFTVFNWIFLKHK